MRLRATVGYFAASLGVVVLNLSGAFGQSSRSLLEDDEGDWRSRSTASSPESKGAVSGAPDVDSLPTRGALFATEIRLTASDAGGGIYFGHSVSVSGDVVIVGAPRSDGACPDRVHCNSGSAYIFQRNEGGPDNWGEVTELTAGDAASGDSFGGSVSISGNTTIVGAIRDDDACPSDRNCNSGAAYIFRRNEGDPDNWHEVAKLVAGDRRAWDTFGYSVSISGDIVVIGARTDSYAGSDTGSAYVFQRDEGGSDNWGEVAELTADDAAASDLFGFSVSISGDTALIGALSADNGRWTGSAYVFQRDEGGPDNWGQVK